MIPRVFVSSTYYDLKHVRERIEKFIENYGFEAVLFESDKVIYQIGNKIDQSAYYEVNLCHILILIVGGRYGSPSSQDKKDEERKKYDDQFISITQKEFETAMKKNIPVLIFIDKNVYGEFQTYKKNQVYFDNLFTHTNNIDNGFTFAHVDNINVFKFIEKLRNNPFKTFEKIEEIESYLKTQFSGYFYLYLESLKEKSDDNKVMDTVNEINNLMLRMDTMLNTVGKEILTDKNKYEKVIENQFDILVDFFVDNFKNSIEFEKNLDENDLSEDNLKEIVEIIFKSFLDLDEINSLKKMSWKDSNSKIQNIINRIQEDLMWTNPKLSFKHIQLRKLNEIYIEKVFPFVKGKIDEMKILSKLQNEIKEMLFEEVPF